MLVSKQFDDQIIWEWTTVKAPAIITAKADLVDLSQRLG
jgi:predicted nuclease of predicted toxin-antitoxin system